MSTAVPAAPKTADPDALVRKEVARILKGPVADKMRSLIPPLANNPDAFKTVMESPELLEACLQLFKVKRDMFAEFLNDEQGNPVKSAPYELVRLALPRRVYTRSHYDHVGETLARIAKRADSVHGFRIVEQSPILRHFRATLAPVPVES